MISGLPAGREKEIPISSWRKKAVGTLGIVAALLVGYACYYAWQVIAIGAAYKAKMLCSGVFVSQRNPKAVLGEDLAGILDPIATDIDVRGKSVSAAFPLVPRQRAIFREGLGCTLLAGAAEAEVRNQVPPGMALMSRQMREVSSGLRISTKDLPPELDSHRLDEALNKAFAEPDPAHPVWTRAVVVACGGRIIAERYAPGISPETALPGWSMTKSVMNALVGILVKQGKLSLEQPVPVAEWSGAGDPRADITLDQMLRMSSGLEFWDLPGPFPSDLNRMLFRSRDVAAYAIAKPLAHTPDSQWYYSSGTSNILSRIIRTALGGNTVEYFAFPRRVLFDRIGMHSAVMETDAAGNFVGSAFMYATARDWTRFGLLYLQDGMWEGERILPEGWVAYSATPTPQAPRGRYGAHFWTNGGDRTDIDARPFSRLPADMFYASGSEGQYVIIIPSRELVVVRLGWTRQRGAWDMESFVADVLAAISDQN